MATWTAAELRDAALEHMGLKAQSQAASAGDAALMDAVVTSVHPQLEKLGLADFAVSAIPEWAQQPLAKYCAAQAVGKFGFTGQRRVDLKADGAEGQRELADQHAGYVAPVVTRATYF